MKWLKARMSRFESKLVAVQLFLVLPVLVLLLIALIYWTNSYAISQAENSSQYLLQTTANNFDDLYKTTTKLLEIPYTEKDIYSIITREYDETQHLQKMLDLDIVHKKLYYSILYYQPNVSSIVIASEIADATYTRKAAPATSPNFESDMWQKNALESAWYKRTMSTEKPVITVSTENELYQNSGLTVSFSQRLKDVFQNLTIGAMRIDVSIAKMSNTWNSMIVSPNDIFFALDDNGKIFYSTSEEFLTQHPIYSQVSLETPPQGYILTSVKSPQSGFTFAYLTSRQHLLKNGQMIYFIISIITIIYVVGSLGFILWSSKMISRPIKELKNVMIKGQEKDLNVRCPALDGEMNVLSESFNSMMDTMCGLIEDVRFKEQEKSQLSYEILQSKISPHFLYNTLNAIRWRAETLGASDVARTLDSLASLLKFTIKCTDDLIPFETELTQLENYVDIMRIRYGDDIEINYDIDEECYNYKCLKFLIQPAMENCYIHAFAACAKAEKLITVAVKCHEDYIKVVIEDNGNGIHEDQLLSITSTHTEKNNRLLSGFGIANLRSRIHVLFGPQYDWQIESQLGEFTRIIATIPKISIEEDSNI